MKVKKTKLFYLYIILGAVGIILSILFAPIWGNTNVFWKSWGSSIVNMLIGVALLCYIFGYLFKKVTAKGNGTIKVLTIIEFILLLLIAIGCFLAQFKILPISGACKTLGFALWIRGVIELFRAYFHQRGSATKYPMWWLVVAITMVTLGTYMFASPLFDDILVLWIFVAFIFLCGIIGVVYGILANPKSTKKSTSKTTAKK